MEELYATQYTDDENGDIWLAIFKGLYQKQSTRGNIIYPVVKFIGNVNINQRRFLKGAKHPKKITIQQDGTLSLTNSVDGGITLLTILLTEVGYPQILINEIINVINTQSINPNIKTYKGSWDESNQGVVNF